MKKYLPCNAAALTCLMCVMMLAFLRGEATAQAGAAGDYPSRPVEMLVAYAPGGGQDMTFRLLARYAEFYMGQRIVISNRTGGGNAQGKIDAINAAPDGYVLGTWTHCLVTDALLRRDLAYTPQDVRVVCIVGMDPHVITVNKKLAESENIRSLQDLIAYSKANPGRITFGAGGNWTGHDFLRLKIENLHKLSFVRLPFLGGIPALKAVAAGNCDIATPLLPELLSMHNTSSIVPLAIAFHQRVPQLPDLPTTAESGMPELSQTTWRAISVPNGTPDALVSFLESVFRNTVTDPKFIAAARRQGITPHFMNEKEASIFIAKELESYKIKTEQWGVRVR